MKEIIINIWDFSISYLFQYIENVIDFVVEDDEINEYNAFWGLIARNRKVFGFVVSYNDFYLFLPEIFFCFFLFYIFLSNIIISNSKSFNYPSLLRTTMILGSFFFFVLTLLLFLMLKIETTVYIFNDQFCISKYLTFFKLILSISSFCFCFLSLNYIKYEKFKNYEFALIIFFSILGMLLLISSNNMLVFYLALELQTLCLFILATYKRFTNFSVEAGLKYFILGGFSSGVLLFGISLIYGITGLVNFNDLSLFLTFLFNNADLDTYLLNYIYGIFLSFFFILIAIFFKLGLAPFHIWIVDVYEGSPTLITAFFSIIAKISIFAIIFKFISSFIIYFPSIFFYNLIVCCSLLSLFIGAFGALLQTKIKRILAYSAISNSGFMLLGISVLTFNGFFSVFFYLIVYIIISLGLFSLILSLRRRSNKISLKNITDLRTLKVNKDFILLGFIVNIFSLAGIPPLAGFFSKFFIFMALTESNMFLEIFFALFASVVSCFYYIRLIKIIFFNDNKQDYDFFFDLGKSEYALIGFSILFNVCFILAPLQFLNIIYDFAFAFSNNLK